MKINCFIVDDEYHVINTLKEYIAEVPYLELIGFNSNPQTGIEEVNELSPDVVFLDINMPMMGGMDFCSQITCGAKVIFVTGYREYAFDAFSNNAFDYILKPVSHKRFMQSIHKILSHVPVLAKAVESSVSEENSYIYIKHGNKGKFIKVEFDDIFYIESAGNTVIFKLEDETYTAYVPLKNVLTQLPENNFIRIHKSFVVNHKRISHIDGSMVVLQDKTILQLGSTYKELFFKYVESNALKSNRLV